MDHKEKDDLDVGIQACSAIDCTGLILSLPQDKAEKEACKDLYPYVTKVVLSDKEWPKAGRAAQNNAVQIEWKWNRGPLPLLRSALYITHV